MTGWQEELALCEKERVAKLWIALRGEKQREYVRRYRARHPDRVKAMKPLHQARWKMKLLGLPQPPLPPRIKHPRVSPDSGIEVPFDD